MNKDDFEKIVEEQISKCREILIIKAREYATEDRLHNFKVAAKMEGITSIQALAGMMAKHTVSIYDMCRGDGQGEKYWMDVWGEKITDHINYLLLLRALVEDTVVAEAEELGSDLP